MNILYIGHERDLNGASMSLLGIIDELINYNNIFVLSSYSSGPFIEELKKRNVKIINEKYTRIMITKPKRKFKWVIKRCLNLLKSQKNYLTAIKLFEIIKENNIDIIHTNSSVLDIGLIISKKLNIPHVMHIREFGEEDFNMYNVYPKSYYVKRLNKNCDAVIAVSKAVCFKYEKYIKKNKMFVIYNGINTKNLKQKSFISDKKDLQLIISGRVEEAKGQGEAILALNELMKRGYKDITLNIAGNGNISEMKELSMKLEIENNVKFLGRVDNLLEIRKNMDLELVCSRCEAFGRVTIEAMMSMIPVIGANTGGTKELIKDGYNGFLYKKGDFEDLANKIEELYKDRSKIRKMGGNAYTYSKDFTSKRNARNIYNIYEKIVNRG